MQRTLIAALGALLTLPLYAQDESENPFAIEHKIPPGYEPADDDLSADERGLWFQTKEYEEELRYSNHLSRNLQVNFYVEDLVCKLAGEYCGDIRVYVLRSPDFNAFMTATGMMVVYTGTLARVDSKDELAAILGHEIAHYTRLHTLDRLRKNKNNMAIGAFADVLLMSATGVPIGQLVAVSSSMSFSRDNETEADFLGARIMAEQGYNPHASYQVWDMVIEEETRAAQAQGKKKRQKATMFYATHPDPEERAKELKLEVNLHYGEDGEPIYKPGNPHAVFLSENYDFLMETQFDTGRSARLEHLLERHRAIQVEPALVDYYLGELYIEKAKEQRAAIREKEKKKRRRSRRKKSTPDEELPDYDAMAVAAFASSANAEQPHPGALRELGYIELKAGNNEVAYAHFERYLELKPMASDREMIEFYLQEPNQDE